MTTAILKEETIKRRQELGQFFTPREVVEFIYDLLIVHLKKDAKWQNGKYPSVIDPACGEGIFLKLALGKGITQPKYVFGADIDEKVKEKWAEINLLKSFGSSAELDNHFSHQDGLLPLPDIRFRYKKGGLNEFDLVVGNPPYGGVGVDFAKNKNWKETFESLKNYQLPAYRGAIKKVNNNGQSELFSAKPQATLSLKTYDINAMKSIPIEAYFVERFIQLCKPGGHIAIIVPDGMLANENAEYVRKFVMGNTKLEASISLPRGTFSGSGTSAKTSILILTKLEKPIDLNYPVFLAIASEPESKKGELNDWLKPRLDKIYECYYQSKLEGGMNPHSVKILKDPCGEKVAILREDVEATDVANEQPFSRMDPLYWHPKYEQLQLLLARCNAKSLEEMEGNNCIISGDHVRPSIGEKKNYDLGTGIEYYETKNFLFTGYDYSKIKECSKNAYERLKYTAVEQHDILISCAGVGGVGEGRSCIITHKPKKKSCTGDVFIIRLRNLNPFLVYITLNSNIGKEQILRNQSGVGTVNINSYQTLALRIPSISDKILENITKKYATIIKYHDKAMKSKIKGNEAGYVENIEKAEVMLKDLIARTEAVIKGKRKDI